MNGKLIVGAAITSVLAAAAFGSGDDGAFDKKALREAGEGRAVYLVHCARCHGSDARGGFTNPSHVPTPDLTRISARDGRFDRTHVAMHIDGRRMNPQDEMPSWGKFFASGRPGKEGLAATRVYALTRYLDFVQASEPAPAVEH